MGKTDEAEAEKTESDSTAEESAEETDSTDASEKKSEESTESTDGSEEKSEETTEAETTTTTEEPKIEYDYVWKVQKRKVTLKIRAMGAVDVRPMGKTEIKNSTKVLLELDEADRAIRDTAAALNDLESFVLERRPLLYEDEDEYVMQVSTEEERETLIALLTETEDWLFDVEDPTAG